MDIKALIDAAKDLNEKDGMNFRGRKYTTVALRVELIRRYLGLNVSIETDVLKLGFTNGDPVVLKATIRNVASGAVLATGHAFEVVGQGNVNKTSALENAETSAIGRACAALGVHGGEFASANELDAVDRKGGTPITPVASDPGAFKDFATSRALDAKTPKGIASAVASEFAYVAHERIDEWEQFHNDAGTFAKVLVEPPHYARMVESVNSRDPDPYRCQARSMEFKILTCETAEELAAFWTDPHTQESLKELGYHMQRVRDTKEARKDELKQEKAA